MGAGTLNTAQVSEAFKMTQLAKDVLAHVWNLVNPEKDDTWTKPMFASALHLLMKHKKGASIPQMIPLEMGMSLSPENAPILHAPQALNANAMNFG